MSAKLQRFFFMKPALHLMNGRRDESKCERLDTPSGLTRPMQSDAFAIHRSADRKDRWLAK